MSRQTHPSWILLAVMALSASIAVAGASPPAPLARAAGSPFTFNSTFGGHNSNVVLPSPDQKRLFVSNQDNNRITVLNVGSSGTLTFQGSYPVPVTMSDPPSMPTGLATNPAGSRLYVAICEDAVAVFDVAFDGSLAIRQVKSLGVDGESCPAQGIVYVSKPLGGASDYVFVNNGWAPNTVTRFQVKTDGSLMRLGVDETGGDAGGGGLFATPSARSMRACTTGCHLFVANGSTFGGTNDISAFSIGMDGSLTPVMGSPFALPADEISSGAIALSPEGTVHPTYLFAGTWSGRVVRFKADEGVLTEGTLGETGVSGAVNGLEVHPCGEFLAATFGPDPDDEKDAPVNKLTVLNTDTLLAPVGLPMPGDGVEAAGLAFNATGSLLFAGNATTTGQQVSVYRFNPYGDITVPVCQLVGSRSGPPVRVDIRVQDTGSGIAAIVATVANNCDVSIAFQPGIRDAVLVTATKRDSRYVAQVELRVTDCAGNVAICDPVIAEIEIPRRKSHVRKVFRKIPAIEHYLTLENGVPGLRSATFRVNESRVDTLELTSGETRTVDVVDRMRRNRNTVTIIAKGEPGTKALLTIGDMAPDATLQARYGRRARIGDRVNVEWGPR